MPRASFASRSSRLQSSCATSSWLGKVALSAAGAQDWVVVWLPLCWGADGATRVDFVPDDVRPMLEAQVATVHGRLLRRWWGDVSHLDRPDAPLLRQPVRWGSPLQERMVVALLDRGMNARHRNQGVVDLPHPAATAASLEALGLQAEALRPPRIFLPAPQEAMSSSTWMRQVSHLRGRLRGLGVELCSEQEIPEGLRADPLAVPTQWHMMASRCSSWVS